MKDKTEKFNFSCPLPKNIHDRVLLSHGDGGKLTRDLIDQIFRNRFTNDLLEQQHDGAIFNVEEGRLAFTTDSFVVSPLFFPGGNIGDLAINGTVNDLAMCGAIPRYISLSVIIEEGFPFNQLELIADSIKTAADNAGVKIVTGDTKVVEKGKGDGIFINTSGIGTIPKKVSISLKQISPGDLIIINGDIARHGIAILAAREDFELDFEVKTDSAPLNLLTEKLLRAYPEISLLRDPTRGGLAGSLKEIALSTSLGIELEEDKIPIDSKVMSVCEILGFDPLYIANEGKLIAFIPEKFVDGALKLMREDSLGKKAGIIGRVTEKSGQVELKTRLGSSRLIEMLSGEQLPRIC